MRIYTEKGSAVWALHQEEMGKDIVSWSDGKWVHGFVHGAETFAVVERVSFLDVLKFFAEPENMDRPALCLSDHEYIAMTKCVDGRFFFSSSMDCQIWGSCSFDNSAFTHDFIILPPAPSSD